MATCSSCSRELPSEFAFCPFCAAPLTEQSIVVGLERKVVSVLFCDLVGFTAASERADPEDVLARLRPYHERLRVVLERHGGTVEKFVGDAVMAVFGAPLAHEDDAERAVRAGLKVLEAIEELNEAKPSIQLQVRVGIHTGEVVAMLNARPELGEGIVTGDVVNTAARVQSAAPVNAVAVSEQTFHATERIFEWEPLDAAVVKGKSEPLALWRLLQPRARSGSELTRAHASPLVGRELERRRLIAAFEQVAQDQCCRLVRIAGEPGIGKSRLCAELFRYLDERPGLVTLREGRCLPYGDGIAFWPLGEIVKAECGILESDTTEEATTKLQAVLPEDDEDRAWLYARLAPLVGGGGEPVAQEEAFAAWRRFLESLAAERPAVLVFEDLHWADPALLAFIEHLAAQVEDVPLLLVCTERPELGEQHPNWAGGLATAAAIQLTRLTDEETARLVSASLERSVIPDKTQQELLERAGGNPLFAEEFVRLLADRGHSAAVPESLQALIAARLDALAPEAKGVLQDASVVGKVFWAGALRTGGRTQPRVEEVLSQLAHKHLVHPVRRSSMRGEAEYAFSHVLVRDVCYQQIPRASRAARHEAAAEWLQNMTRARVEDLADVLAFHYLTALELRRATGDDDVQSIEEKAFHFLALAGERALALDIDQAERHFAQALQLAPTGHPERARLLESWAHAVQLRGRPHEAMAAVEEALELHQQREDRLAVGRAMLALVRVLSRLGDPRTSRVAERALRLLEAEPPGPELVEAYAVQAGVLSIMKGRLREALDAVDQAISLAADLGLRTPSFALGRRGVIRCKLGDALGVGDLREALRAADEQGEGRAAALLYNNLAYVARLYEGPQAALDVMQEGIAFCGRRGISEHALLMAGASAARRAELGQSDTALIEAKAMAEELETTGNIQFVPARALHLRLLAERGEQDQAPDPDEFAAAARDCRELQKIAAAFSAAAQVLRAQGRTEPARSLLHELEQLHGIRADPIYAGELPALTRTALALDEIELCFRLIDNVPAHIPLADHALTTSRAQLAEAAGQYLEAAALYADAASRWQRFGNVPEDAYALLGQGRCLHALGDPAANQALTEARELFASIGYKPALAETEAVLRQGQAAAS